MKKNLLKIGDKVAMKKRLAKWYVNHLDVYMKPDGEMGKEYYAEIPLFALALAHNTSPIGKITHYGSTDNDGKNFVKVKFKYKGFGVWCYFSESDLVRV